MPPTIACLGARSLNRLRYQDLPAIAKTRAVTRLLHDTAVTCCVHGATRLYSARGLGYLAVTLCGSCASFEGTERSEKCIAKHVELPSPSSPKTQRLTRGQGHSSLTPGNSCFPLLRNRDVLESLCIVAMNASLLSTSHVQTILPSFAYVNVQLVLQEQVAEIRRLKSDYAQTSLTGSTISIQSSN